MKVYAAPGCEAAGRVCSTAYGFEYAGCLRDPAALDEGHVLYLDAGGLGLRETGKGTAGPVRCEFVTGGARHRRLHGGGKSQTIAKAVGIRDGIRPTVADLTAGLGGDAFVLASLGCPVRLVERNPVAAALLEDGMARAAGAALTDEALAGIVARMTFHYRDGRRWLDSLKAAELPDVIYLDPMFPERRKSARVKKEMEAFQAVVGEDGDAGELLPLALAKARHRVVVKRPVPAPWLNDRKPGYSLRGKSVRFDIYPLKSFTAAG